MFDREKQNEILGRMKLAAFFLAMLVLGALGLSGTRPSQSTVEKRELAKFPAVSLGGVWDGSFFSGVDTWYADTYPARESLISADLAMEEHYGVRTTQIVGSVTADAIPDEIPEIGAAPEAGAAPDPNATATPVPTAVPTPLPDGTVHEIGEFTNGIYITNNAAYGLYSFSQSGADSYVNAMNDIYAAIGDKVNVYVMDVPQSARVMLDDAVLDDMGCSDEGKAIEYVYSRMDPGIKTISVFDTLRQHNAEYVYFRTDHHWTQLGAYYAYREFCALKGWQPHELSQFRTTQFGAGVYLGSFYTQTNKSPELAAAPDTVQAWYPMCVNADDPNDRDMFMIMQDGSEYDWRIINDMFDYPDSEWYCVFAGADRPFSSFHNESITDGSAVMVVKDSYGNAFIPWLVDHYEYTYWVDFRYTDNTVSQMVADYGVQDVIFESATSNATGGLCNDIFRQIGT